jgi:glycosyltransferase involved in cell wall biosynthesis
MTILVITNRPLTTFSNGYDLRVWYLCHALKQHEKLVQCIVPLTSTIPVDSDLRPDAVFSEIVAVDNVVIFKASILRHLRWSEAEFFRWGYPEFQQSVIRVIENLCKKHDIEKIIVFGSNLAGLIHSFSGNKKILFDVCDSVVLTAERQYYSSNSDGIGIFLKNKLMLVRWKNLEGKIPLWFDRVTTINRADTERIIELSRGSANVTTIPNGVDPAFESAYQEKACLRKGVAFWGNLSFPPNSDAVRFFYHDIYLPYLKPAGIEWCIVGRDAESWLVDVAKNDGKIRLTGYVQDLRALLAEYPVMVNPMRIGSGMKNKVLEAFAMGMAVVSTPLGIESIVGASAEKDYMAADNAEHFAKAIIELLENEDLRLSIIRSSREIVLKNYTWNIVGRQWVNLFNELSENR